MQLLVVKTLLLIFVPEVFVSACQRSRFLATTFVQREKTKNKICLSTDIFIYIFYKINLIFSKYTIIKRCTLQKKKVTRNSIYTHRIIYYFGRQERGPVQCKQLVTLVTQTHLRFRLSRPWSRYIQNSKKCALRNLFQQSVLFVSLSAE